MSRDLAGQESVAEVLARIVFHAVELVDGCEAAGILTVSAGRVETLAATDDVVRVSDRMQQELGEGPCFDATRNRHEVYRIPDMTASERRWPRYAPKAAELGIGSAMGFLLHASERDNLGALDLYSSRRDAFTEQHEQIGWVLAAHASVAMAGAEQESHLQLALKTRQKIGVATGVVMSRYGLDEQQAFERIRRFSQNNNVKLRELAETIVYTGDIPAGER